MKKLIIAMILILGGAGWAQADMIFFRNGKVIQGEIIRQTPIYIRLKPQYGVAEREFLIETIQRIVEDGQIIYQREMIAGMESESLEDLPYEVQQRAEQMAQEMIEQAMRKVDVQTMTENYGVQSVAQEKASELLKQAVLNANAANPDVQNAATEMATALIEESVRSAVLDAPGFDQAPSEVKEAARAKATALIDAAIRSEELDELTASSEDMKMAAKEKASALIEKALKDVEVPVVASQNAVQRTFDDTQVDQLMQEALQKRQLESATNHIVEDEVEEAAMSLTAADDAEEDIFNQFKEVTVDGKTMLHDEEKTVETIVEELTETEADVDTQLEDIPMVDQATVDQMVRQEVEKALQAERERLAATKEQAKLTPEKFLLKLGFKDFIVIGFTIALLIFLLFRHKKKNKTLFIEQYDVAVTSSLTYQNLPEELKGRITSSDVTTILQFQACFQDKAGLHKKSKSNEPVMVDDEQLVDFIFENAKKKGLAYRRDDIVKVLETQDATVNQSGSS